MLLSRFYQCCRTKYTLPALPTYMENLRSQDPWHDHGKVMATSWTRRHDRFHLASKTKFVFRTNVHVLEKNRSRDSVHVLCMCLTKHHAKNIIEEIRSALSQVPAFHRN